MPTPPVSQYKPKNKPTAFHVKKNGAARQPACTMLNQMMVPQSRPPIQGSATCSGLSARRLADVAVGTTNAERSTTAEGTATDADALSSRLVFSLDSKSDISFSLIAHDEFVSVVRPVRRASRHLTSSGL